MRMKFQHVIDDFIESETSFNAHRQKLSKTTIILAFQDALIEVAEEIHSVDDPDLENKLEEMKQEVLRNTLGRDLETYTVVFPLNLKENSRIPGVFSMPDANFERISEREWEQDYEQPARENDETSLSAFLEESPNDLYESDGMGGVFTFWRMDYDARDHRYALSQVPEIVRLLLSELNFVIWQWTSGIPRPASNERPPNARWSELKEPFIYLIFSQDEYLDYLPYDYELRRGSEGNRRNMDERIERFEQLPGFSVRREELTDVEETIANALVSYQDGITESSIHQSFFAFWRGLEILTQVERGQGKDVVVERALFTLENVTEREFVRRRLKRALDEIEDKRNSLVHEGPHTGISHSHRDTSKLLLDAMLELYFSYYDEDFSNDDFRQLLKYGTMTSQEREAGRDDCERTIEIINRVQQMID